MHMFSSFACDVKSTTVFNLSSIDLCLQQMYKSRYKLYRDIRSKYVVVLCFFLLNSLTFLEQMVKLLSKTSRRNDYDLFVVVQ